MKDLESTVMARWQEEWEKLIGKPNLKRAISQKLNPTKELSNGLMNNLLSALRFDTLQRVAKDVGITEGFSLMESPILSEICQMELRFTSKEKSRAAVSQNTKPNSSSIEEKRAV
jgi:hypothetical protein